MASQLLGALSSGFTSKQILDFLLRKFPQHSDKIKDALKAGFTVEQVIKFLGGGREAVNQVSPSTTEHEQTRDIDIQRGQDVNQMALKGAGTAALAGGAALGAPMLQSALQRAAPQLMGPGSIGSGLGKNLSGGAKPLSPTTTGISQIPTQNTPISNPLTNPQTSASQPPISPSIPNAPTPVQAQGISNIPDLITKSGLGKHIEEISKNVKDPKGVAALLYNKFPKEMQKLQKEAGKPMEDVVAEYMGSQSEAVKPLDIEQPVEVPKVEENPIEVEPIKIEKGSLASSPEGIGEVKAIRNGKAIIEVDGKKHQVDESELESPLFSEDEIADAYEDLFKKIPEEHKSGFISWSGYDEDRNVLGFIPRGGKYEELHNITPEEAEKIKEGRGVARTSGEEREGLWVKGGETRGGIISQIIHDRKKKQKEQQAKQLEFPLELPKGEKTDRGMKPIFDEMAHARELSRAREKKKRDEEKARLKKEKEDEKRKKRKK